MTNSWNTPIEAIEHQFPLRVRAYRTRKRSGGAGLHRGGDGVLREIEFLCPAELTLLSDRRRSRPYGLRGGEPGRAGANTLIHRGRSRRLAAKVRLDADAGDVLRVETPGGGGYGER